MVHEVRKCRLCSALLLDKPRIVALRARGIRVAMHLQPQESGFGAACRPIAPAWSGSSPPAGMTSSKPKCRVSRSTSTHPREGLRRIGAFRPRFCAPNRRSLPARSTGTTSTPSRYDVRPVRRIAWAQSAESCQAGRALAHRRFPNVNHRSPPFGLHRIRQLGPALSYSGEEMPRLGCPFAASRQA